jgi:glutamyl-tRNA reductase
MSKNGLEVHVIGLSIHSTPIALREMLSTPEAQWNDVSKAIVDGSNGVVVEAAVISTCNRFEVYFSSPMPRHAIASVCSHLATLSTTPLATLRKHLFILSGADCIDHLYRVAGGLDSLIIGEGQILSQVRQAFLHASNTTMGDVVKDVASPNVASPNVASPNVTLQGTPGQGGRIVSRLLNTALASGKRVRAETSIAKGSVSVSSAAVELTDKFSVAQIALPLTEARVMVIGAGKMGRLLITHLLSKGVRSITVVVRDVVKGEGLVAGLLKGHADVSIDVRRSDELDDLLLSQDVVYTATSAESIVLSAANMRQVRQKVIVVDIAVPRNVCESVKDLPNIKAYNVDDLTNVVAVNTGLRQKEIMKAEDILKEDASEFRVWMKSLRAVKTINQLQEVAEEFRLKEIKKHGRKIKMMKEEEREVVERMSRGIVNKLLHGTMRHLKKGGDREGVRRVWGM